MPRRNLPAVRPRAGRLVRGFTLVELVLVITLVGILAVVAAPRFFNNSTFDERGYRDEIGAALRYAQKVAVATGCPVRVTLNASGYALGQQTALAGHCDPGDASYATPVRLADGEVMAGSPPAGVTVTPSLDFVFGATGGTTLGGDQTVNVGSRALLVNATSGLVTTP
ncbi:MAG: prepilin-type N-terminal cleavage/methylation domain-containing protein [Gammaproteobacteria bacterium]|nr:prepilin-type N-terminal cleavage/methylation domain-containing protein [Gammaproteobacteria bacterium]